MSSGVDLIVATLSLDEVQLVVGAMRSVDQQAAAPAASGISMNPGNAGWCNQPAARYEPHPVLQPSPQFEARPVIYRVAGSSAHGEICPSQAARPEVVVIVQPPDAELPLQPPWKTVPWQIPSPTVTKVKVVQYHPDMISKGMLIDIFI